MIPRCPGNKIEIFVKVCGRCGTEVELFTGEEKTECPKCGLVVYRDKQSCYDWCQYSKKCYGEIDTPGSSVSLDKLKGR